MNLGAEIRRRREERGWSQQVLSGLVGIPQGRLSEFERGVRDPRMEHLRALSELLGPFEVRSSLRTPEFYREMFAGVDSINVRLAADAVLSLNDGRGRDEIHRSLLDEYGDSLTREQALALLEIA